MSRANSPTSRQGYEALNTPKATEQTSVLPDLSSEASHTFGSKRSRKVLESEQSQGFHLLTIVCLCAFFSVLALIGIHSFYSADANCSQQILTPTVLVKSKSALRGADNVTNTAPMGDPDAPEWELPNSWSAPYRPDDNSTWMSDGTGERRKASLARTYPEVYKERPRVNWWKDRTIDNVMVMLFTHKGEYAQRRERIMRTWGKHVPHLYTFVGSLPDDLEERIARKELLRHRNDTTVVLGQEVDTYKTLHHKVFLGHKWVCEQRRAGRFKDIQWFMKIDDDAFLVTYNLGERLKQYNASEPLYMGVAYRDQIEYASGGAGVIFSGALVDALCDLDVWEKDACDFWPGLGDWRPEDECVGMILRRAGIRVTNMEGLQMKSVDWNGANWDKPLPHKEFSPMQEWLPHPITFHYATGQMLHLYAEFY